MVSDETQTTNEAKSQQEPNESAPVGSVEAKEAGKLRFVIRLVENPPPPYTELSESVLQQARIVDGKEMWEDVPKVDLRPTFRRDGRTGNA